MEEENDERALDSVLSALQLSTDDVPILRFWITGSREVLNRSPWKYN